MPTPCHRVAWPRLEPRRTAHMEALTIRTGACSPLTMAAVRPDDLRRGDDGSYWLDGSLVLVPSREYNERLNAAAQGEPNAERARSAYLCNALTQLQLWQRAVADVTLSEEDFVLFNEDDMVLHPHARELTAVNVSAMVRWAYRSARTHGLSVVRFSYRIVNARNEASSRCSPLPGASRGLPGWPALHTCRGTSHGSGAYALTKARARVLVQAWAALTSAWSAIGPDHRSIQENAQVGRVCAARLWGGPHCMHDPAATDAVFAACSRRSAGDACRSLVVGHDWADERFIAGPVKQAGLFLQARTEFGSLLSSTRNRLRRKMSHSTVKAAAWRTRKPPPADRD